MYCFSSCPKETTKRTCFCGITQALSFRRAGEEYFHHGFLAPLHPGPWTITLHWPTGPQAQQASLASRASLSREAHGGGVFPHLCYRRLALCVPVVCIARTLAQPAPYKSEGLLITQATLPPETLGKKERWTLQLTCVVIGQIARSRLYAPGWPKTP